MAKQPNWIREDLEFLREHWGSMPDEDIGATLKRTKVALKIAAYRKLGKLCKRDAFYTSAELARLLGTRDGTKIVRTWVGKGWLKARKGPFSYGLYKVWRFEEEDVVECLRRRPWLVDRKGMDEHFFRTVVENEWTRDPWYTPIQAAPLLGVKMPDTVHRYIYRGWLPAEKRPGGPYQGVWIIRRSALDAFLRKRGQVMSSTLSRGRHQALLALGLPTKVTTLWRMICPSCREEVAITAPPSLKGPEVKAIFIAIYANGRCEHGAECSVESESKR